jgi:hypothetical protein
MLFGFLFADQVAAVTGARLLEYANSLSFPATVTASRRRRMLAERT